MKKLFLIMTMMVMTLWAGAQSLDNPNAVWRFVEQLPEFKGGNKAFSEYMSKNLICPEEIKNTTGEYKTLISFIVEKDGTISHARVAESSGNETFDAEALRLISQMPNWKCGKQKGQKVRVAYSVPVLYKIEAPADNQ